MAYVDPVTGAVTDQPSQAWINKYGYSVNQQGQQTPWSQGSVNAVQQLAQGGAPGLNPQVQNPTLLPPQAQTSLSGAGAPDPGVTAVGRGGNPQPLPSGGGTGWNQSLPGGNISPTGIASTPPRTTLGGGGSFQGGSPSSPSTGGYRQPFNPGGIGTQIGGVGGQTSGPGTSGQGGGTTLGGGGGQFSPININNPAFNIPTNTPSGANPAFPAWSAGAGGGGAYSQGDPGYMASSEANRAVDYGNMFENQYGPEYQQALAQQGKYQGAADTAYSDLYNNTPGYTSQESAAIQGDPNRVMGTVNATGAAMNSAIDPNKLGVSDQYVSQLKDQAGRQIGLQYSAAQDQLQRQAEASGNVNPLALSAARDRLLRSSSIDQADAVTGADLAATGAQRQANTGIAQMKLGAATTLGGMGLQAGQYADTANSQRASQVGQQRIQGQQAARNYWQSQGQFQGGQANQATQARLSGAQTSLSGMGQGGQLAATTEIGRRSTPRVTLGTGGVSVGL